MTEPLPASLATGVARAGSAGTPDRIQQLRLPVRRALPGAAGPIDNTAPRRSSRAGRWAAAHWRGMMLVGALLLATAYLVGRGIDLHHGATAAERAYVANAWALIAHGRLAHHAYSYSHPPFGWVQLGALMWLLSLVAQGVAAVATARWLMLVPACATVALVYVVARRLGLRRSTAALAAALLIASPLGVQALRQLDLANFALPWTLAAFALALSPRRRLWAYTAGGGCMALAALSSLSALLLLPGLILVAYRNSDPRTRAFCLTGLGTGLVLIAGIFPLYALLRGELVPSAGHPSLLRAVGDQIFNRTSTGSVFAAGSQSRSLIDSWLSIDPWLLGLGAASVIPGMWMPRLRPVALALGLAALVPVASNHMAPAFDVWLLPLCALLSAGTLDALLNRIRGGARR